MVGGTESRRNQKEDVHDISSVKHFPLTDKKKACFKIIMPCVHYHTLQNVALWQLNIFPNEYLEYSIQILVWKNLQTLEALQVLRAALEIRGDSSFNHWLSLSKIWTLLSSLTGRYRHYSITQLYLRFHNISSAFIVVCLTSIFTLLKKQYRVDGFTKGTHTAVCE